MEHRAAQRLLVGLVAGLVVPVASVTVRQQSTVAAAPPAAVGEARGIAAVRSLIAAGRLDAAADAAGIMTGDLVEALAFDASAFVDGGDRLGYVEPVVAVDATTDATADAVAALTDVSALHSNPSSPLTVLLDVDGHTTSGTGWNASYTGGADIVSAPYSTDADPTFSETERANIVRMFHQVAEDFAGFDVDVTTEDPGPAALRKSSAADTEWGIRIVVSTTDWYRAATGRAIGGIAYVGSFTSSTDTPAFVFASNLARGNPVYVAEAASHEAGHTFGLQHDGVVGGATYYEGHGDWAPIMGVGYGAPVTQWDDGSYPGSSNATQDDLATIRARTGLVDDDRPDTPAAAVTTAPPLDVNGVIAPDDPADAFSVSVPTGTVTVTVTPVAGRHDLVADLTITDAAGGVVATVVPSTAAGWSLRWSQSVPAGRYGIVIRPTGWPGPDGFSDYGSRGGYRLTVTSTEVTTTTISSRTGTTTGTTTTTTTTSTTTSTTAPPPTDPPPNQPAGRGDRFSAVVPFRAADTRDGTGGAARPAAGTSIEITIAGRGGVPREATAAVLTVAAVRPEAPGYLSVTPCRPGPPATSTVNFTTRTVANTTIATLTDRGTVCVVASSATDVVIDVTGYLAAGAADGLVPQRPVRVVDTRTGLGGTRRLSAGQTAMFSLAADVPAGTTAAALNITAVGPSAPGFVTAFPCGASRPIASTVNHGVDVQANNTIVGLGAGATLCVYTDASLDLVIDVTGTMHPASTVGYVPAEPSRLLDTRVDGDRPIAGGGVVTYRVPPSPYGRAVAAAVNLTATRTAGPGFVTAFACGPQPSTSNVNFASVAATAANGAIADVTASSTACLSPSTAAELLVDLSGWWVAAS